jgi:hypothetical protein
MKESGMSHYYHKANGRWQRWIPRKANGEEYQRIPKKMIAEANAVIGITSQIGNHTNKDWLGPWCGGLGIEAGWEVAQNAVVNLGAVGDLRDMTETDLKYAKELLKEKREQAANKGNEFHDAIEDYINGEPLPEDPAMRNACEQVKAWLTEQGVEFSHTGVKAEHCVGFNGGIVVREKPRDAGQILRINNGATADLITRNLLGDWKTIEMSGGKFWTGKADHCAQLAFCRHAAFNEGLCDSDAKCVNVYIDRATGNLVEAKTWTEEQLDAGLEWVAWCWEADNAKAKLESLIK